MAGYQLKIDDEPVHRWRLEWAAESENVLLLSTFRRYQNCDLICMAEAAAKITQRDATAAFVAVAVPV
jgi:hypothetical protein